MKKGYLALGILSLAFITSCQNEELFDASLQAENKVEVSATLADADQSRTHHSADHTKVLWSENDAISVFTVGEDPCHDRYYLTTGVDKTNAKFQWDKTFNGVITGGIEQDGSQTDSYVGVYPFMEGTSVKVSADSYEINTVIPTNQKYAENSFGEESFVMVGVDLVNAKPNIAFKNVGTILIFPLKGEGTIQTATLKSETSKIAGKAVVTISGEDNFIPSTNMENGENEITLSCGEGVKLNADEYTKFCFVLAPGVYTDLVVKFTDTYGNYFEKEIENPNGKEMKRSMSYNMPKMTFEAQGTEEIDLWVKAKAGAYMTAERIIPSINTLNVEEWVKNLMAQPDTRSRLEQAATYIQLKNYEGAFDILGGIPGFERNNKNFTATGVFYQKVDYTGTSYITSMLKDIENINDIPSLLAFLNDFEGLYEASGIKNKLDESLGSIADNFDAYIDAFVEASVNQKPDENLSEEEALAAYKANIKNQLENSITGCKATISAIDTYNNTIGKWTGKKGLSEKASMQAFVSTAQLLAYDIENLSKEEIENRIKSLAVIEVRITNVINYNVDPSTWLTGAESDYADKIKEQIASNETLIAAAKAAVRTAVEEIASQSLVESLETAVNEPESTTAQVLNYLFAQEAFMETVKTSLRDIVADIEEASKDNVDGENVDKKAAAISTAKTNAILYARANAVETILADLEAENYNNLNNDAWGSFKQVLAWEKTVEFFAENKMTDVYDALVELGKVIDDMITYTRGSIYYDIAEFADYQENVDWWVVKFIEEI